MKTKQFKNKDGIILYYMRLKKCECVLKLLGWNLTDCDGVYGQYTIMCSVDSVRYVDG